MKRMVAQVIRAVMLSLLYACRAIFGRWFIKGNFRLFAQLATTSHVLRVLGATIGQNSHIHSDICIYNARDWSFGNLRIGSNVYVGPRCVFDLTDLVCLHDDSSISAQVSFITHLDVGNQPLKRVAPRRQGPISVGRGAWIGVNTTVLHDVTIGEFAMVGAMSLVNRPIAARTIAFGIPARVIRRVDIDDALAW